MFEAVWSGGRLGEWAFCTTDDTEWCERSPRFAHWPTHALLTLACVKAECRSCCDQKWRRCTTTSVVGEASGTWEKLHDFLRAEVRIKAGRRWNKRAGITIRLAVKTVLGFEQIKGRKRHIVVVPGQLLLGVCLSTARSRSDQAGNKIDVAVGKPISGPPDCSTVVSSSYRRAAFKRVGATDRPCWFSTCLALPWAEGLTWYYLAVG